MSLGLQGIVCNNSIKYVELCNLYIFPYSGEKIPKWIESGQWLNSKDEKCIFIGWYKKGTETIFITNKFMYGDEHYPASDYTKFSIKKGNIDTYRLAYIQFLKILNEDLKFIE